MTEKKKKKKTIAEKLYIVVSNNSKSGVKSVGGLSHEKAIETAKEFNTEPHTESVTIYRERIQKKKK